ncbi:MAG: glycosyltransferase, partial [Acidobacteriota bacterium]|nr:glycosyltransferase [Acidobacteriota bacterium]
MQEPLVTLVVVPRERFSFALESLDSIYEHTGCPFSLVYVDGGSPAKVRRRVAEQAERRGFRLIRTDRYLSPNEARNIGLREVKTKYVVFIDNDVLVTPGWLERLVQCAEETGAWLVGPLYLEGEFADQKIHMAGGALQIKEEKGKRVVVERHRYAGKRVPDLPAALQREPTEVIEFHTVLARTEMFAHIGGGLDEGLLNTREHVDLCLAVREAGGSIYLEPNSVITYVAPPPFAISDIPFYILRWSDAWSLSSMEHFNAKWNMTIDRHHTTFINNHRRLLLRPLRRVTSRVFGWRADKIERAYVYPVEQKLNRFFVNLLWRKRRETTSAHAEVSGV